jgi:mRNA interferase RelE/StbE
MKVTFDKSFVKDIEFITQSKVAHKIADAIEALQQVESVKDSIYVKKLKGFNAYYRLKVGEYRLGFRIDNRVAVFERCLHRKEIYKYFPKK